MYGIFSAIIQFFKWLFIIKLLAFLKWLFGGGGGARGNCPVFEGVWTGRTTDPSYAGGAATVLTLNFPAAPVDNLLIAVCGVGINPSTVGPAGWNKIVGGLNDAIGGGNPIECQLNVFWKLADGTETSASFDFGPNPRQAAGAVLRYSDVNTASPIGPHGTASGVSTTPRRLRSRRRKTITGYSG